MAVLDFQYREGGIHFPDLRLWLDPHWPKEELVFVSHAHSDHTAKHREVILSAPTARLMTARLGGKRIEHVLEFGATTTFQRGGYEFRLTLFPAGHIFGSAMALIESERETLLYTGDFKLRPGMSAERCQPVPADTLIMETTYGRPKYRFPPTDDVMRGVVRFCREALDNDETAVLFGYSLGKSQELLCALADAALPIVLHGAVFNMTKVYEQFDHCFPTYEKYTPGNARGKVVLCPPHLLNSAMLKDLGKMRCAVLTGWAVDPGCRFQYRCDAAFPISDHADFPDLIEFVKQVRPKRVFTLHGFAADFAATLRELGFEAAALSEDEQMTLGLRIDPVTRTERSVSSPSWNGGTDSNAATVFDGSPPFHRFAETCAAIAGTAGKLEKIAVLAEYLRGLDHAAVPVAAVWFTGLPFAATENRTLQVGWALLRDALCTVASVSDDEFHHVYLKHSDLGETAFELFHRTSTEAERNLMNLPGTAARLETSPAPSLPQPTIAEVQAFFEQIQSARGPSTKLPLLIRMFARCAPLEIKYLVKIITSDLRIGVKEGLVEEAIAQAFHVSAEAVRRANLLLGHIGDTAGLARENRLADATIRPFRPLKFMLASPVETAGAIWERLTGKAVDNTNQNNGRVTESLPGAAETGASAETSEERLLEQRVWLEDKYDGIRCQLHKVGARVALYSRDLKEISDTFHDVAEAARQLSADVILDGEVLAMRGPEVLPFSELQKRLGRREHDLFLSEEVPIRFVAFDLLWQNGKSLLDEPLRERRETLEELRLPEGFALAQITSASSVEETEAAFAAARARRHEGLLAKDPESTYSPGRRGLAWLKLKKAYATLDCVVVGAEYGHGKRSRVLSDYTFAVRDENTGELKTIGKAYSGLTDAEIARLTDHFLAHTIEKRGRFHVVEPDIVVEIAFDRIQRSDRHSSGWALRFPRFVRIRTDKSPADIDTVATAARLAQ